MATIWLRTAAYLRVARAHGHHTYAQQGEAAGIGAATIWRARNGYPVSAETVAKLLNTYGVGFTVLFSTGASARAQQHMQAAA